MLDSATESQPTTKGRQGSGKFGADSAYRGRENTLGKRIAIRRRLLDLTQDRLATLCGVDGQRIRDWESDRLHPDASLPSLAAILEVSIEWLETGRGSFGQRLKERRQQLKLTQLALSKLLGNEVSVRTIKDWEADRAWPKKTKQIQVAGRLNVPLEWLLTGVGLPTATKLVVKAPTDERFLLGIAQLKMALGLRFDREAERLLLLQDGALRRARDGKEQLPVHAKYAVAAALGWSFDQELVYSLLSEVQRVKIEKMTGHFDDIDSVRDRPRRKARQRIQPE